MGCSFRLRRGWFGARAFDAVRDVDLRLARGETLGIVGESGSGKSTLGLTLLRLAQGFGPVLKFRGADGVNSACAWVNVFSVYAHMAWPAYGAYSAAQSAMLGASLSLRGELRPGGVRVVHVFTGPTEDEWFQPLPPPKVAHSQVAKAIVDALKRGLEETWIGDVAQDFRARLQQNPKALEREVGQ